MSYVPITPFRRMAGYVPVNPCAVSTEGRYSIDKWAALRELAVARKTFSLSDRDLTVLQALISFHPSSELSSDEPHVVFPSNVSICARLNGMPCSTMRRHIAALVRSGMILRRDSPNGKRYRRRNGAAFGFDISPLVTRFTEIETAADAVRAYDCEVAQARETLTLMCRDLRVMLEETRDEGMHKQLTEMFQALRRKVDLTWMRSAIEQISALLEKMTKTITALKTTKMSINVGENEHHQQRTNSENYIYKKRLARNPQEESLRVGQIMTACKEMSSYAMNDIDSWDSLRSCAETIRPMMGICRDVWDDAKRIIGDVGAAVTLGLMLQRFERLSSPNGYLKSLSLKASKNSYDWVQAIQWQVSESSQL